MRIVPTPWNHHFLADMSGANYAIHRGYEHRTEVPHYDDTPNKDEFQKEIYAYARQVLDDCHFTKITDIGCGSGYKLITNFFDMETLGLEVQPTLDFCRKRWPGRRFEECDLLHTPPEESPIVVCADVIEHLIDPDQLLRYIQGMKPARLILSTPSRDHLNIGTHNGPPKNIHHVREWSAVELHAYIERWFLIREHFVINGIQCVDAEMMRW